MVLLVEILTFRIFKIKLSWLGKGSFPCHLNTHTLHKPSLQTDLAASLGFPWWLWWYRIYLQCRRPGLNPWVRKTPWRRKWQLTPVSLPGKSYGERSLADYSPWSRKESDTTELRTLSLSFSILGKRPPFRGTVT